MRAGAHCAMQQDMMQQDMMQDMQQDMMQHLPGLEEHSEMAGMLDALSVPRVSLLGWPGDQLIPNICKGWCARFAEL